MDLLQDKGIVITGSSRGLGTAQMFRGALREGWRRLTHRPAPPMHMKIAVVPAALPLTRRWQTKPIKSL